MLDLPRRTAMIALGVVLALNAVLLTKQVAFARVASRDAAAYYLPLAADAAAGGHGQHLIIPPLYPLATGWLSRLLPMADDPLDLAGRLISAISLLLLVTVVYALGRHVGNRRVGLVAAGLTAVNVHLVRFGASIGPEMLYALLLAGTVLVLFSHVRTPRWWHVPALALGGALAALTRSEGVYVPLLILAVLAIQAIRRSNRRRRLLTQMLLLAILTLLVWTPRLVWVHEQTGHWVLDVRALQILPWDTATEPSWWRPPLLIRPVRPGPLPDWAHEEAWTEEVQQLGVTLLIVFGPVALGAIILLAVLRRFPRRRRWPLLLLAAVVALQIAMVAPVTLDRRYLATISPIVQIWGGLGVVAVAEAARRRRGIARRFGDSLDWQMALVWVILGVLAGWSLLSTNVGQRHAELRTLGQAVRRIEPHSRPIILATTPETPYYAGGLWVRVRPTPRGAPDFSPAQLGSLIDELGVQYIVYRSREHWAQWLREALREDSLAQGVVVAHDSGATETREGRDVTTWLLDARRLRAELSEE